MMNTSPNSCQSVAVKARWNRLWHASRKCLSLLAVVGVGALFLSVGRVAVEASDGPNAAKKKSSDMAGKMSHMQLAKSIDTKINNRLKLNEVAGSDRCSDSEFIRRVSLDITGMIPSPERVQKFLDSTDKNKRAKLIDELLESPRYGKFLAELWTKQMVPAVSNNRRLNNKPLQDWLAEKLNKNTHWDKLVYELVTANAPQNKNGAVTFFIGNFGPEKVTDKVSQMFLGVQLQCAQCHNHPFTEWKQDEYWGMAAFFTKVGLNVNPNQAARTGVQPTIKEYDPASLRGNRGARGKKKKRVRVRLYRIPRDGKRVPASFLTAGKAELDKSKPYRPILAKWITSKKNRFFARAISNKLWYHFFGRGIVNPADDMHDDNPATHPQLLKLLEGQVKANDFDLKYLIRAICNSETYQRSSRPKGNNADDAELFSHALVRQLSPEQLYDSLESVVKTPVNNRGNRRRPVNRRFRTGPRDQFISFFSGDDGYKPLEYQAGIPQALRLMNSRQLNNTNGTVAKAMKAGQSPAKVIEYIYLATVARRPTAAETKRLTQYVNKQTTTRVGYSDVLWALLNSSEFALNH